jgi:hypothetical protein
VGTYKTKNSTSHAIALSNLMGGECLVGTPESIPDDCLQLAYNWEYGGAVLQPQVVDGVATQIDFTSVTTGGFYDSIHDLYLVASGTSLYKLSNVFSAKTLIGTLTGTYAPVFLLYDTYVLITSGGQIQKWDGTTLTTIAGSPVSHHISFCFGRVRAYSILSAVINYSSIGDCTSSVAWVNTPSDTSSSQYIDVGYKDAGTITASMMLSQAFMVIKSSGIPYRIAGEEDFTSVAVVAAADKVYAYNHYCGLCVGNTAYFVGKDGFESFSTVTAYGYVKTDYPAPGYYINSWLVLNADTTARMWHIPSKRQIWVKGQNDKLVYIYHYNVTANGVAGSWTRRQFFWQINDVICNGNNIYVLYGNKIGRIDDSIATDDGNVVTALLISKRVMPQLKKIIVTHLNYFSYNMVPGNACLQLTSKQYSYSFSSEDGDIYGDNTDIYGDNTPIVSNQFTLIRKNLQKRLDYLEASITVNAGRIAIHNCSVTVNEVNF